MPVYELEDLNNQPTDGSFYPEELTPVVVTKQTQFKIDKILSTRVRRGIKEHKARWVGYGPEFDSWVKASDIVKLNTPTSTSIETTFTLHCSAMPGKRYILCIHILHSRILSHSLWTWVRLQIGLLASLKSAINHQNVYVYCDLIAPQLVGSELKRVLRTIIAPSQTCHHTFPNIYYLPVQKQLLTYVHIELALGNDSRDIVFLDDATPTPTKVVLHFRRTKWEMLPVGIEPCTTFQIDKIVDTRSRRGITEDLVQWKVWDPFYSSWLPRAYIQEKYVNPSKSLLCNVIQ